MMLSRYSKVFFLTLCLAALHSLLRRTQAEAVALKPSGGPARPTQPGKVVIQLDFSPIDSPKSRGGNFKTNSLKPRAKKDLKGEVAVTLGPKKGLKRGVAVTSRPKKVLKGGVAVTSRPKKVLMGGVAVTLGPKKGLKGGVAVTLRPSSKRKSVVAPQRKVFPKRRRKEKAADYQQDDDSDIYLSHEYLSQEYPIDDDNSCDPQDYNCNNAADPTASSSPAASTTTRRPPPPTLSRSCLGPFCVDGK